MSVFKAIIRESTALIALTLLPCLWWWPLLCGYLPDFMDTVTLQYPMRMAAARQIWEGTLPLWLPEIMSGVPLAANPEVAVWYPPNWLFLILPGALSYGAVLIFHYVLGGCGVYFLGRQFGCTPWSSLLGALTLQFGAFMVSHIALPPRIFWAPWIPWLFLAVELHLASRNKSLLTPAAVAAGVLFALQLLAGASQFSFYTALALPLYWMVRASTTQGIRGTARNLATGLFAAALAVAFSAIQLLPTISLLTETERAAALDVEGIKEQALSGSNAWRAFVGGTGEPIEDTDTLHAIGLGALLLVPFAFFRRRRNGPAVALILVGFLGYLLALAPMVPVWSALLPLFDNFHAPRRALVLWSIAGPILVCFGAHYLHLHLRRRRTSRLIVWIIFIIVLIPNALMLPRLERVFTSPRRLDPPHEVLSILSEGRFYTLDPSMNYAHGSREEWYADSMLPNLGALHGVSDIQGYNSFVLRRYGLARTISSAKTGVFYPKHGAIFTNPVSGILRLMHVRHLIGRYDLYDPTRVMEMPKPDFTSLPERLTHRFDHEKWPIWQYRDTSPFAWLPNIIMNSETAEEALDLAAIQTDPYWFAFLDKEGPPIRNAIESGTDHSLRIDAAAYEDARTVRVMLNHPVMEPARMVVVSVSWTAGWTAYSNDLQQPLEVVPANGINTAIVAPAGTQDIRLVYAPNSFRLGAAVTLVALIVVALLFVRLRRL